MMIGGRLHAGFVVTLLAMSSWGCRMPDALRQSTRPAREDPSQPRDTRFAVAEPIESSDVVGSVTGESPASADDLPRKLPDIALTGSETIALGEPLGGPRAEMQVVPAIPSCPTPHSTEQLPSTFWDLTLDDAVAHALQNSQIVRDLGGRVLSAPGLSTTTWDAAIQENDPLLGTHAALSEFDTSFSSRFFYEKNDRVFNNVTLGGGAQELRQDLDTWQAEWQRVSMLGTRMALRNVTLYDDNNRVNNLFRDSWESQWQAELRQPLLQGAGLAFNEIAGPNARPGLNFSNGIVLARLNQQISAADFELAIRRLLSDVHRSYWDLHLAYADHAARLRARDSALRTWETIRARASQELRGGEADKEAQARAQYYYYEDLCLEALNGTEGSPGIYSSERQLRHLLGLPPTDGRIIRPISDVARGEVIYDFLPLKQLALQQRVELQQQSLRVRQQEYRLLAAKNFLLPRLDATAQYRLRGFGDDLTGGGSRFASAYHDIASLDHQEWGFGLELNSQLGFRRAQAAVRQASLQLARERTVLKEQELAIEHALSDAVARATQVHASLRAAEQRVRATHERVLASEAAFTADQTSVDLLLDAQEQHYSAQYRLSQLQTAYVLALWEVDRQTGSLLSVAE